MPESYEPNASNLVTVNSAIQNGDKQADAVVSGLKTGADFYDQLQGAQLKKQQIQAQMQANRSAMVNHVSDSLYNLSSADDDEKKGPVWKMRRDETVKNMTALGVKVDPDAMNAYLNDPKHSAEFSTALGAIAGDPSMTPQEKAQAVSGVATKFSSMEGLEGVAKSLSASQQNIQKAKLTQDKQVNDSTMKISNAVKQIDQKYADKGMNLDSVNQFINNEGKYKTGVPDMAINDVLTKALSGGVVRSFTLAATKNVVPGDQKLENWLQQNAQNGKSMNADQLNDYKKVATVIRDQLSAQMDKEKQGYFNQASAITKSQSAQGKEADPLQFGFDPDTWNRLSNKSKSVRYNATSNSFEKNPDAQPGPIAPSAGKPQNAAGKNGDNNSFSNVTKQLGYDPDASTALQKAVKKGMSLDDINSNLQNSGRQPLSQAQYKRLQKLRQSGD